MKKTFLCFGIGLLIIMLLFSSCDIDTNINDDIIPTNEVTQNVQLTPTSTATAELTPTPTATAEPTPTPTEKPTPKPTAKPTEKPIVAPTVKPENKTEMVWITKSGKKYHSNSKCSNMKAPYQVSKENAMNSGRGPCSKCY